MVARARQNAFMYLFRLRLLLLLLLSRWCVHVLAKEGPVSPRQDVYMGCPCALSPRWVVLRDRAQWVQLSRVARTFGGQMTDHWSLDLEVSKLLPIVRTGVLDYIMAGRQVWGEKTCLGTSSETPPWPRVQRPMAMPRHQSLYSQALPGTDSNGSLFY